MIPDGFVSVAIPRQNAVEGKTARSGPAAPDLNCFRSRAGLALLPVQRPRSLLLEDPRGRASRTPTALPPTRGLHFRVRAGLPPAAAAAVASGC